MKNTLLMLALGAPLFAQTATPGTVVNASKAGTTVNSGNVLPAVGAVGGVVISVSVAVDNITCTFRRPTAEDRRWSCAANGTAVSGVF